MDYASYWAQLFDPARPVASLARRASRPCSDELVRDTRIARQRHYYYRHFNLHARLPFPLPSQHQDRKPTSSDRHQQKQTVPKRLVLRSARARPKKKNVLRNQLLRLHPPRQSVLPHPHLHPSPQIPIPADTNPPPQSAATLTPSPPSATK